MKHALVQALEKAFGWAGPEDLGARFVRGVLPDVGLCARILTVEKLLDIVMRRSLSNPQVRIHQDGAEIHPARFLDDTLNRRSQGIRVVNMARLGNLLTSGCTVVLDQADMFDPTLEVACRALQWWTRELVQVNTYLTTGATDGFPLHWDDHEVIVVQLAGEKEWEVRGCSRNSPMYRDAAPNDVPPDDVLWKGTLRAGEAMNIPRGYWHRAGRAELGDGFSLHTTFGVTKRTGVHWLAWAADQARREEIFRRDLDREGSEAQPAQLMQAAMTLLGGESPSAFLQWRETEQPVARHVPALDFLGAPDRLVCVSAFRPTIECQGNVTAVLVAGRRFTFAAAATPALELLLSGHPVTVNDVSTTTGVAARELADLFLKEKICAPLTPELSSGYTDLVTTPTSLRLLVS